MFREDNSSAAGRDILGNAVDFDVIGEGRRLNVDFDFVVRQDNLDLVCERTADDGKETAVTAVTCHNDVTGVAGVCWQLVRHTVKRLQSVFAQSTFAWSITLLLLLLVFINTQNKLGLQVMLV